MIFSAKKSSEVAPEEILVFMVEIHVRFLDISWFCQIPHFFHHIHAIGWCSCRCPLEPFNSGKRSPPRGLRFALLKIFNGYREISHRAPPSGTNWRNDRISDLTGCCWSYTSIIVYSVSGVSIHFGESSMCFLLFWDPCKHQLSIKWCCTEHSCCSRCVCALSSVGLISSW